MGKKSLSVIVSDANLVDTKLLQLYLSAVVDEVFTANSSDILIKRIVESIEGALSIDVVVLNRTLKGTNGIETTKLIRDAGFQGRVIGTASDLPAQIRKAWIEAGCDAFLIKPISVEALKELLSEE